MVAVAFDRRRPDLKLATWSGLVVCQPFAVWRARGGPLGELGIRQLLRLTPTVSTDPEKAPRRHHRPCEDDVLAVGSPPRPAVLARHRSETGRGAALQIVHPDVQCSLTVAHRKRQALAVRRKARRH